MDEHFGNLSLLSPLETGSIPTRLPESGTGCTRVRLVLTAVLLLSGRERITPNFKDKESVKNI
jgi:hypothetical protein